MNETLDADARKFVDQYLDAIEQALAKSGTPRSERQNITRDVEAHILDLFAARYAGNPTPAETQTILGELDSPEDYARGAIGGEIKSSAAPATVVNQESRLSRAALAGAIWAPFIIMVLLGMMVRRAPYHSPATIRYVPSMKMTLIEPAGPRGPEWWQYLLMFTMLPLGLAAPFGTTILGLVSIGQIRHAAGKLHGLPLAVCDTLLFPLLTLDAVLFFSCIHLCVFISWRYLGIPPNDQSTIMAFDLPIWLALCALSNGWIIRRVWRAAKAPVFDSI